MILDRELDIVQQHNRRMMTIIILLLIVQVLFALGLVLVARRMVVLYLPGRAPAAAPTSFHGARIPGRIAQSVSPFAHGPASRARGIDFRAAIVCAARDHQNPASVRMYPRTGAGREACA